MDETGIILQPESKMTWHTQRATKVPVMGKEEKRAFILSVGSTMAGNKFISINRVLYCI